MNNKPDVVSDAQLDQMQGREIFRTVYERYNMPPPSSDAILDQIRNGDYTQMSGAGGSAHGRAIYFATDYSDSAIYGHNEKNAMMMRAKLKPTANIRKETSLRRQMNNDLTWQNSRLQRQLTNKWSDDDMALYAIAHGIDGWYDNTYTMMINRGAMTASSRNKTIKSTLFKGGYASSWNEAEDAT